MPAPRHRFRLLATGALAIAVLLLHGCPRDVQEPEPGEAQVCDRVEDCNGGRACGMFELRLCVDGLCEARPSVVRPCLPSGSGALDAGR